MSYFDHVRCHACKAMLDPESLAAIQGQGMSCPHCKAPLSLKDLFGLADAYAEDDQPDLTLDDLLGSAPTPTPAPPPQSRAARPSPAASRPSSSAPTSSGPARLGGPPAPPASAGAMVRRGAPSEDHGHAAPSSTPSTASTPSALEIMRSMRKKKP